jgi:hypothetical protein
MLVPTTNKPIKNFKLYFLALAVSLCSSLAQAQPQPQPQPKPLILNLPIEQLSHALETITTEERIEKRFGVTPAFVNVPAGSYVDGLSGHPLLAACEQAYAYHQGFELSPEVFWTTVLQGAAIHVAENKSKLKGMFTGKGEKTKIKLKLPPGEVDWPNILSRLSTEVYQQLPKQWEAVGLVRFSNSNPGHLQVFELAFLHIASSYFYYEGDQICGIPQIKITGTRADWQLLAARIQFLESIDMAWWLDDLQTILQQVDHAFAGQVDEAFWCSIYKIKKDGCQDPYLSGWIANLIPYTLSHEDKGGYVKNRMLAEPNTERGWYKMDDFPAGISGIDFKLNGEQYKISGGIIGSTLETGNFITPQLGWGVRKVEQEKLEIDY